MNKPELAEPTAVPSRLSAEGLTAFVVCGMIGVLLLAYREPVLAMVHLWRTSDTYAHGALIPFVTIYLLYQNRNQFFARDARIFWPALLAVLGSGALWAGAALADIEVIQQLAVVAILLGLVLLFYGTARVTTVIFPLCFLFLAVPMGDGLIPPLVEMTADFVVAALRWSGIPVYRDGTSFVIPSGSWSVVSGCSGMRYLMATITVGMLFAYLNYRSIGRRILFVAVAMVVAIVGNWLRAYAIVMIAHLSDMKLALGVDHLIYGWVFFGILIFILMSVGMMWSEPPAADAGINRARHPIRPTPAALFGAVLLGAISLLVWPLFVQHLSNVAEVSPPSIAIAAQDLGPEWRASTPVVDEWKPYYAGDPVRASGNYSSGEHHLGWDVAWYGAQRQGVEVINAANHLVAEKAEPWRLKDAPESTMGPASNPNVTESILRERAGDGQLIVWQWYWVGGHTTTNRLLSKLYELNSLFHGHGNPGASVLVFTLVGAREDLDQARHRLRTQSDRLAQALNAALDRTLSK
ncbi:MAG: exosortase A [Gammaproteobacteria bacterium]|nr:exosortase A [Gammaproteobacteria bacterium]